MVEFIYNYVKDPSTYHRSFKLNYNYHPYIFCEDEVNLHLKYRSTTKLAKKLKHLISICQQNLYHVQELQKQANGKGVKPRAMHQAKRFGRIANTLEQSKIKSLKLSFLAFSKFYI